MRDPLIVLKFGSSVLGRLQDLPAAVHEIYRWLREGHRVLAVVSALGDATDRLFAKARRFGAEPNEEALVALVATGEATAAALLGLALDRAGVPSVALDAERMGLQTEGSPSDASPCGLNESAVRAALDRGRLAVAPGFTGRLADGRVSLLGRGGSDLTAVFLAQRLGAERCRLIKDVDGLYERDPNASGPRPRRYRTLAWNEAWALGGGVVQEKALRFAQAHQVELEVASLGDADATVVGPRSAKFHPHQLLRRPLRVALLGLGMVGSGVYWELAARPDLFEVSSVVVRRPRPIPGPAQQITDQPWQVFDDTPDVVVELMGGKHPAQELIAEALARGIDVVTANKAVLASDGLRLRLLAERSGAQLLCAGAVGGAVPMLETVERVARRGPLRGLHGVLNGTSNYVLDRVASGLTLSDALRAAQAQGFAEADPSLDLDGTDVAQKLTLLARAGFGSDCSVKFSELRGIDTIGAGDVRQAAQSGRVLRLVGSIESEPGGLTASVAPRSLEADHLLARVRREENGLVITPVEGEPLFLQGKGAGRWPTTEAVIADLMTISRVWRESPSAERPVKVSRAGSALAGRVEPDWVGPASRRSRRSSRRIAGG